MNLSRQTVSACIIALNEEASIAACIQSVSFCDEVIVVDSGSTDATRAIAAREGARVIEQEWLGFARQRNVALDHASSEWVFEIDADERASPELRQSMERFLAGPPDGVSLAAVPLRNVFLGRRLGHSSLYPEYRTRLFRRADYRHDVSRTVHEGIAAEGRAWPLEGDLEHLLAGTLRQAIRDKVAYARLEVRQHPRLAGHRAALNGVIIRPAVKFAYRLVLRQGWRDGLQGVLRLALEAASDAAVSALLTRRGRHHEPLSGHFGRRHSEGERHVFVATSPSLSGSALEALSEHEDTRAVLIAPTSANGNVAWRRPESGRTLDYLAALDAESQLGPIGAVVALDRRALIVARLTPPGMVGSVVRAF